jgi:DMSO/TMAO reductase YedYZ molybdopterin-dependent catalytic subunit
MKPDRSRERVPPNQRVTSKLPTLTYGPVPRIDLAQWRLDIDGLVEQPLSFTWQELMALPHAAPVIDIHCVTGWSLLDSAWEGIASQELMKRVRLKPEARYLVAESCGGYTTNLSVADFLADNVLLAFNFAGEPLTPEHGWPLRLVVPHLYFWKSAKWLRRLTFRDRDEPGFWESAGYHIRGDPWREERYSY